ERSWAFRVRLSRLWQLAVHAIPDLSNRVANVRVGLYFQMTTARATRIRPTSFATNRTSAIRTAPRAVEEQICGASDTLVRRLDVLVHVVILAACAEVLPVRPGRSLRADVPGIHGPLLDTSSGPFFFALVFPFREVNRVCLF